MSIESISHKVVWYVKNTAEIVFFSAAAIMVPILGIKGLKTFNNIDKNIIKPITDVTNALLSDEENPATKIGGLVGEVIKKLKEKDTDGKSSIDRVMECVDSVTGIVKNTSESLKKQTHDVKVKKSDFPAYFSKDEKEEEKVVQMNTVEYAMYQLNMLFKEFTAPAYDTDGRPVVRKIDDKDVPQNNIENMIGNISDIIKSAKTVLSDEQTGGKLEEYLNKFEEYESSGEINNSMKLIAEQEIKRMDELPVNKDDFSNEIKNLREDIGTLKKGEKNGKINLCSKSLGRISDFSDIAKIISYAEKCLNEKQKMVDKIELKEQLLNFKATSNCDKSVKKTLRSKAINNWTNEYLKEQKMNAPVTSIVFQIMIAISNIRKFTTDFDYGQILELIKGLNFNFGINNIKTSGK